MIAAFAVCFGGSGTRGITTLGVGNSSPPPNLNASKRDGPRFDSGVAIVRAGANKREPEPHPTGVITYCTPSNEKLTGTESIAEPVFTDQTFFPLSAAYAANSPLACPSKTRFPAVESTPPFVAISSSTDHRSEPLTGSHAISRPIKPCPLSPDSTAAFASQ